MGRSSTRGGRGKGRSSVRIHIGRSAPPSIVASPGRHADVPHARRGCHARHTFSKRRKREGTKFSWYSYSEQTTPPPSIAAPPSPPRPMCLSCLPWVPRLPHFQQEKEEGRDPVHVVFIFRSKLHHLPLLALLHRTLCVYTYHCRGFYYTYCTGTCLCISYVRPYIIMYWRNTSEPWLTTIIIKGSLFFAAVVHRPRRTILKDFEWILLFFVLLVLSFKELRCILFSTMIDLLSKDLLSEMVSVCEDRIVFYYTSLRAIRRTYEDCSVIRMIFGGLRLCCLMAGES
ncbi:hypothetical protein Droror1_Dr00011807 [Drosera rotundifolia]